MIRCFVNSPVKSTPIIVVTKESLESVLRASTPFVSHYVKSQDFVANAGQVCLVPNSEGSLDKVFFAVKSVDNFWPYGALALQLPEGIYHFDDASSSESAFNRALAWGMGAYQFTQYKAAKRAAAQLVIRAEQEADLRNRLEACYLIRNLINMPAEDMGPEKLASVAQVLAKEHQASYRDIIGEDLKIQNYPAIYAVGKAAQQGPRLVDLRWGDGPFKLTLVGKGVCFDSGGLNIKVGSGMTLMKKDMGGAAHALGFASMIMAAKLPVTLRVLLPIVENAVSENAYRPGDIIQTRKGLSVEITNTDAEGRVILSDALTEAASEKPDLLIDFATLTGAARVALGPELPAMFASNLELGREVQDMAIAEQDPVWPMPFWDNYQTMLDSPIADCMNATESSYAGAITAALFLKKFVPEGQAWLHFDMMAYNLKTTAGRPQGGEMMALRGLLKFIKKKCRVLKG